MRMTRLRTVSPLPAAIMNGLAERLNRRAIIWGDHTAESETGRCAIEISQLGGAGSALGAALLPIHSSIMRS